MRGIISWLIVTGVGFAIMAASCFVFQRPTGPNPWKRTVMIIGTEDPISSDQTIKWSRRPVRMLLLPTRAQLFLELLAQHGPQAKEAYRICFQEKIILYDDLHADFTPELLESGRLPVADANEVIAGFQAKKRASVTIDDRKLTIVGRLKKDVRLYSQCYLTPSDSTSDPLFDPNNDAVKFAYTVRRPDSLTRLQLHKQLSNVFPKSEFTTFIPMVRSKPGPFLLYMAGMAMLLLGGSLALCRLYIHLAARIRNKWFAPPLQAIRRYRHLFIGLHLFYFGLVIFAGLCIYSLPELQTALLTSIRSQIDAGSGLLAIAGKAYGSGSIPIAAFATFVINFPIGSVASITLPSFIIPGCGVLLAGFRAMAWGLLLSPTFSTLATKMLPHSITLLIEGEAYILATFFALLVPIYLFRKAEGPTLPRRYLNALKINLMGNLIVAIVLVIAAIYEAAEVILQTR